MVGGEDGSRQGLRVFVSYRRQDASGHAGRLYDRLVDRFGTDRVFMDIEKIRPGTDFAEVIEDALDECDVLLALVGKMWLTSTDRQRRRRLDNSDDFVRLELEAALRRGITVIPVLLQGAEMPSGEDLPPSLSAFARKQAFELSDRRWQGDVKELVGELERLDRDRAERARAEPALEWIASGDGDDEDDTKTRQLPGLGFVDPDYDDDDRVSPDAHVGPAPSGFRVAVRSRRARAVVLALSVLAVVAGVVVSVALASGRPTHPVPDVKGKSSSEARATLQALKFRPFLLQEFNEQPADRVVAQVPVTGQLKEGGRVTLVVSKGPELVDVPDLSKRAEQDAVNALLNAGLKPGVVTRREDPQAPPGQVLDWSLKGTRQPVGTAIDLTISGPPPPPRPVKPLVVGPTAQGPYTTDSFLPKVTLTLKDGWVVNEAGPDIVVLSRSDRPGDRVSFLRVHRVYNPTSPNNDQPELSTTEDALNSVQDVRDLPNGLAAFLVSHPHRVSGLGGVSATVRGGRNGSQVDGQFRPYSYEGCGTSTNKCVPLFQQSGEPGKTSAVALVGSEVARFEIFDVVDGAKLVMMTSAPEDDFRRFVADAANLLSVEQIEFTDRVSTLLLQSSTNPSDEGQMVTVTAEVAAPCAAGRVTFTNLTPTGRAGLGSAPVVNGKAALDVTFTGRGGRARVVAEYEGSDCSRGVSAPLFQRVK